MRLSSVLLRAVAVAAVCAAAPLAGAAQSAPAGGSSAPPAPAGPVASLAPDATARLDYGVSDGNAKLTLVVTGLDKGTMQKADLIAAARDVTQGETTVGRIAVAEVQPKGISTRFFTLTLPVKKLPRNATLARTLALTVDGRDQTLQYSLTNVSASTFALTVKPPASSAIDLGGYLPVTVVVGPIPATGVKLFQPALVEKNTKRLIAEPPPKLCAQPDVKDCDGGDGYALPANSVKAMFVGPLQRVGTFENQTLTIASAQKPDGDDATFTVYVSSWWHKALGLLAILGGVAVSWLITTFVRNRIGRDQAYLPVVALRRALIRLNADVNALQHAEIPANETKGRIAEQLQRLDDDQLETHGLPPVIPLPWATPGAPDLTAFRQYVQDVATWTTALGGMIAGLAFADAGWKAGWPQPQRDAVTAAAQALDDLAAPSTPPTPADVTAKVNAVHDAVKAASAHTLGLIATFGDVRTAAGQVSERTLRVEISRLALVSWFVISVITVLLGAYVLIYSDAGLGFGSLRDYLVAFFWGVGLPTGAQLATATTSSVGTAFKIPTT